jgi:HSP20 family protein
VALVRSDPFREIDRFFQQAFGGGGERSWGMPMDGYRKDDLFLLQFDVPGIAADGIELSVDNNVLTVKATRHAPTMQEGVQPVVTERPWGDFTRQVLLGDNLDIEKINAEYDAGVLTVTIPVAERARPRRIDVAVREGSSSISPPTVQEQVTS